MALDDHCENRVEPNRIAERMELPIKQEEFPTESEVAYTGAFRTF
jgi:hypothetical protein